ncbi:hypothetical protein [Paenibacillus aceti]|uniref:Knr4/Smi1-like domain-containing protein n=1 Tax=Paenibacillus aceti TaxID=1820010 RepID=A0ABQ1VNL7_9BACL|nr:hypothetical protein [Paenibacillus aceti]GGF84583.1 hypothetical protein GCM10010913_02560 [Paenibacillus aceti]
MKLNKRLNKYSVPEELLFIAELDKEYSAKYKYDRLLGANINFEDYRYFDTPLDVIPFGSTGGDGIHFGFLTDYSKCESLDNAYIVCVSPMDFDKPISLLSRNIREFLGLWIAVGDPSFMDYFKYCSSEDQFNDSLKDHEKDLHERSLKLEPYFNIVRNKYRIEPITNVYQYLLTVQQNRYDEVVLTTQDGIGVVSYSTNSCNHTSYKITRDGRYNLNEISEFLSSCSIESKLALIRDLQLNYVLNDEFKLKEMIYRELLKDNFVDEASNLLREL